MQIRSLLCKQLVDNNGVRKQQMLPISYCRQWERPAPSRNCNLQPCPPPANWTVGEWSKARHFQFFFKSKFWRWTFRYSEKLFGVVPWATQLSAAIGSWLTFRVLNLRRRKSDCIFSLNYFLIHLIPLTFFWLCSTVLRDMWKRSQTESRVLCGYQKYHSQGKVL